MEHIDIQAFSDELLANLQTNILPYWLEKMIDPRGGFYGHRDGHDILDVDAPKGAILNGRILWTFSAAYRRLGSKEYLEAATRAYEYIRDHFVDPEYGGIFWSLNPDASPLDTKKQFYAIGFVIYGLSEYVLACSCEEAKALAIKLFHDIETYSHDFKRGGYLEACNRQWEECEDMRLSEKDDNASKTMNTHLHIIEPYTNLFRIWPDDELRQAILHLMHLFLDVMEEPATHHLGLFYNDDWQRQDCNESYGHDIEASWLLLETAQVLGDKALLEKTLTHTRAIANAALEGRLDNGAMIYEKVRHNDKTNLDTDLHWWVQAEDVIGLLYLWRYHDVDAALPKAWHSWGFIKDHLVDNHHGEWLWSVHSNLSPDLSQPHAGFWKCPYHNSRMCLEASRVLLSTPR